jgi:hypothetical protein
MYQMAKENDKLLQATRVPRADGRLLGLKYRPCFWFVAAFNYPVAGGSTRSVDEALSETGRHAVPVWVSGDPAAKDAAGRPSSGGKQGVGDPSVE